MFLIISSAKTAQKKYALLNKMATRAQNKNYMKNDISSRVASPNSKEFQRNVPKISSKMHKQFHSAEQNGHLSLK